MSMGLRFLSECPEGIPVGEFAATITQNQHPYGYLRPWQGKNLNVLPGSVRISSAR